MFNSFKNSLTPNNKKQFGILFRILPLAVIVAALNVAITFMFFKIGFSPLLTSFILTVLDLAAARAITKFLATYIGG